MILRMGLVNAVSSFLIWFFPRWPETRARQDFGMDERPGHVYTGANLVPIVFQERDEGAFHRFGLLGFGSNIEGNIAGN